MSGLMEFEEAFTYADLAVRQLREGEGLRDVDRVVLQGAWNRQTYEEIAAAAGYSPSYLSQDIGYVLWKRLSAALGMKVSKTSFRNGIAHWAAQNGAQVQSLPLINSPPSQTSTPLPPLPLDDDWGELRIDVEDFRGRTAELVQLTDWIVKDSVRLLGLSGPPGVGKTWLATKVAQGVEGHFQRVVYRELGDRPFPQTLVTELLTHLGTAPVARPAGASLREQLEDLVQVLTERPCLLILDKAEVFYHPQALAGTYDVPYGDYAQILQAFATYGHKSCVIWVGRDVSEAMAGTMGTRSQLFSVKGLDADAIQHLAFWPAHLRADPEDWQTLHRLYGGIPDLIRPLATRLAPFGYRLQSCLAAPERLPNVDAYFETWLATLSFAEGEVLTWLAISREPLSLEALQQRLHRFPGAEIDSLYRRGLCQMVGEAGLWQLTLPDLLGTYLCAQQVQGFENPDEEQWFDHLHRHPLLNAVAPEQVQQWQRQHLLEPVAAAIAYHYPEPSARRDLLVRLLGRSRWQSRIHSQMGYSGGNLINLARAWQFSLVGLDCRELNLWGADLQSDCFQGVALEGSHLAYAALAKPLGRSPVIAVSPMGTQGAIGDHDGRLNLWSLGDGRLQRSFLIDCTSALRSIVFSPDGTTLAEGRDDGQVRLWDLASEYAPELFTGTPEVPIRALAYSPDGRFLAGGDEAGTLYLWRLASGECIQHIPAHRGTITAIAFSPCGTYVSTCGADCVAIEWQVATGVSHARYQGRVTASLSLVAYQGLPEDPATPRAIVVGWDDRQIVLWELATHRPWRMLSPHCDMVVAIALSPDGQYLTASSVNGELHWWHVLTRDYLRQSPALGSPVGALAFTPDSMRLFTGCDYQAQLWAVATGDCLRSWRSSRHRVTALTLVPRSQEVLTAHEDGTLRRWQKQMTPERWLPIQRLSLPTPEKISAVMVGVHYGSPHQVWVVGDQGGNVHLCKEAEMAWLGLSIRMPGGISALALSTDGQWLAVGDEGGTLALWNLATGDRRWQQAGHGEAVMALTFSPDGEQLYSGSRDRTIRGWNLQGRALFDLNGHRRRVHTLAITPDGDVLLSGSHDGTLRCWHLPTQSCQKVWHHRDHAIIACVAVDAQGVPVAVTSDTTTLQVWDTATDICRLTLAEHQDTIWHVSPDPDGQFLLSASQNGEINLWDLQTRHSCGYLRADRPYEGMQISGCEGLSEAEHAMVRSLGAVD
jgi:WD40 repeat protein